MAKSCAPLLTCCNTACTRPFATFVAFCPFCGAAQPPLQAKAPAAPAQPARSPVATAKGTTTPVTVAKAVLPPDLPPDLPPPTADQTTTETLSPPVGNAGSAPAASEPVAAVGSAIPARLAPQPARQRSRLLLVMVMVVFAVILWALLKRGEDGDRHLDNARIEQLRSAVEDCLQARQPTCADEHLSTLSQHAPSEYWSDLQQRNQQLREQQQAAEQEQARSEREQRLAQQELEAARSQEAAISEDAADPAPADSWQTPPMAADRPASLSASAQQRPPVHYPPEALRNGIAGTVVLNINVGADGRAEHVGVSRTSGNRQLDRAALQAARQWQYEPAVIAGRPSASVLEKEISFRPPAHNPHQAVQQAPTPQDSQELSLLNKARQELRAGRFDVAMALAESALSINPVSRDARELVERARNERDRVMSETTIE